MANSLTFASADQLRGLRHVETDGSGEEFDSSHPMPHVIRRKPSTVQLSGATKSRHSTPDATISREKGSSPGTEVFTHYHHVSWSTSSPVSATPNSLLDFQPPYEAELLLPTRYGEVPKPRNGEVEPAQSRVNFQRSRALSALTNRHLRSTSNAQNELAINTTDHVRDPTGSSTSPRAGKKRQDDLYFTPTDVTKSRIWFNSPKGSPTLPFHRSTTEDNGSLPKGLTAVEDSSAGDSKPARSSASRKQDTFKITSVQLDQLIAGLAKCRMVQKHVRKYWWDAEDIPDDGTVTSMETASTPTLTTASTLYSRRVENYIDEGYTPDAVPGGKSTLKSTSKPMPSLRTETMNTDGGGVALTDPKIHGSPIRYHTQGYKLGSKALSVGSCTFLKVPYGVEVECTLHVQPASNVNSRCQIMLRCVNQVVERRTGKRTYLLVAEVDVTSSFTKAALSEFVTLAGEDVQGVEVVQSPASSLSFSGSPEIDWIAIADELQAISLVFETVENTLAAFAQLVPKTCTMQTLSLLSELDRIRDQHQDFIILRPTAFHANGVPSNVRLPWVSQRLYHDWYQTEAEYGTSDAAEVFRADLVEEVAKRAASSREKFTTRVNWSEVAMVVHCVPLSDSMRGAANAWVCFVRGEFDLDMGS